MLNIVRRSINNKIHSTQLILLRHEGGGVVPAPERTLKERLSEMQYKDPKIHYKVDIGLPPPKPETKNDILKKAKYLQQRKNDLAIEKASRDLTLEVDFDELTKDWEKTSGPSQTFKIAEHYGIYNDLFGDAYFFPYVFMEIGFPHSDSAEVPVYRGNVVKPAEACVPPKVLFEAEKDSLWTLVLTSPDGHFTEENMEYVHWFIGNIPGNDVSKGEVVWDYLPPFPPRGVGFQRFVFILYKQDHRVDYSSLKRSLPCLELKERTFSTLEFYRQRQDHITPAGLSFFQSDWDHSVIKTFHEKLNMDEPIFEYDHDPQNLRKQEWFPKKRAFDLYLDNYKDPRDVTKLYLLKKLENLDPFKRPGKPFPYPNIHHNRRETSWYGVAKKRFRCQLGRARDQEEDEYE